MKLSASNPVIINFDAFSSNSIQQHDLGTVFSTADFRTFRYALAGASNLTGGNVATEPASKANHLGINPSATAAVGQNTVSVTVGATAVVSGEYNEGFLAVSGTPGNGQIYKISYTGAIASSGTGNVVLDDLISTNALTTSSIVNLIHNPANGTIEGTTQTRHAIGVPENAITAGNYYFAQSRGYAAVAADAATAATVGAAMVLSGSVSGAVTASASTFSPLIPVVGENTLSTGVASKNFPIFLTID